MRLPRLIRAKSCRHRLGREIALMLALKLLLLYGLWSAFFSHPLLPKMTEGMDPDRVAASLVSAPQPTESREGRLP